MHNLDRGEGGGGGGRKRSLEWNGMEWNGVEDEYRDTEMRGYKFRVGGGLRDGNVNKLENLPVV